MSASTFSNDPTGIIIQYEYCTGCRACELACKQEHDFSNGEFGIEVMEHGPKQMLNGKWDYFYIPVFTDSCDACGARVEAGKLPACVHHCTAKVMEYGLLDELSKKMAEIRKCVLFAPAVITQDVE